MQNNLDKLWKQMEKIMMWFSQVTVQFYTHLDKYTQKNEISAGYNRLKTEH